ncbi:MAG TPA: hypothetical protein VHH73_19530 [Verrucomicrobiae bacterium]|nr:hypothetical protein [Verrucomicrobiae bacterium]
MTNLTDESHEQIEKLLSWKRHEKPPPGYFNRLSAQIMARVEAEELAAQENWWQWLASTFAKPAVACAYGMGLGAMLVFGLNSTQAAKNQRPVEPGEAPPSPAPSPWQTAESMQEGNFVPTRLAKSKLGVPKMPESSLIPVIDSGPPSFLMGGGGLQVEMANFTFR